MSGRRKEVLLRRDEAAERAPHPAGGVERDEADRVSQGEVHPYRLLSPTRYIGHLPWCRDNQLPQPSLDKHGLNRTAGARVR
jgi:hypothetical protein